MLEVEGGEAGEQWSFKDRAVRAAGAGGGEGLVLEIRCSSGGIMVKCVRPVTVMVGVGVGRQECLRGPGFAVNFSGGLRPWWTSWCGPIESVGRFRGRGVRRRPDRSEVDRATHSQMGSLPVCVCWNDADPPLPAARQLEQSRQEKTSLWQVFKLL